MKMLHIILGTFMLSLFACQSSRGQTAGYERVSAEEFYEAMQSDGPAFLLDVRTPQEWSKGKIGEARNMNYFDKDFRQQLEGIDKNQTILLYCNSGRRSARAATLMLDMGFTDIVELSSGYQGWLRFQSTTKK